MRYLLLSIAKDQTNTKQFTKTQIIFKTAILKSRTIFFNASQLSWHEFILDKNLKQATGNANDVKAKKCYERSCEVSPRNSVTKNRPFSKMAAEISNKSNQKRIPALERAPLL